MFKTKVKFFATVSMIAILFIGLAVVSSSKAEQKTSYAVILVGHGIPPSDYPKEKMAEWFKNGGPHVADNDHGDHGDHGHHDGDHHDSGYDHALRTKEILYWPRTEKNDLYYMGVKKLAEQLQLKIGQNVSISFNEFCAPTLSDAVDDAVARGEKRIVVISTMMTAGGGHSEKDIPASINIKKKEYPGVEIVYAWPFDNHLVAETLATQINSFSNH